MALLKALEFLNEVITLLLKCLQAVNERIFNKILL